MADKVAVLIPCYNEAVTIGKVVDDFKRVLPDADIYVYDNNSKDGTADIAREHGAIVKFEGRQGKGNVVRSMFRDVDADYYLMVDGDDTYPAEAAPALLEPLRADRADMTVGDRLSNGSYGEENDRAFHGFGNDLVRWLIKKIYGFAFDDVMTGYRAFNRVFVKTMPVLSEGFQIETEISIHAVDKRWRIEDVPIDYRDRPEGSYSKLSTFGDGAEGVARHHEPVQGLPPAGVLRLAGPDPAGAGRGGGHPRRRRVRGHRPGAPHPHDARQPGARRLRHPFLRDGPYPGHGRQEPPPPVGDRRVQSAERLLSRIAAGALPQAFVE